MIIGGKGEVRGIRLKRQERRQGVSLVAFVRKMPRRFAF
jgi:hypothetical protein